MAGSGCSAAGGADERVRRARMLGDFELLFPTDGTFRLDGGAMFGVVPKTLWGQRVEADAENRVRLGLNSVVVRTGRAVVLIETGIGNKQSPKMRAIHDHEPMLPGSIEAAGVRAEDVTHVVNTHLHFDHCGWNTTMHADGGVTPTFPNARYFAAAGELAHGRLQLDRDRVSYLAENYDPVIANGQMTLLDPGGRSGFVPADPRLRGSEELPAMRIQTGAEIVPGVWVEAFPGHTASMLAVHVESVAPGGAVEHACYIGDLIPTHHHLQPTWGMGFDLDPLRCIEERKRFLARAIPERWMVLYTHDAEMPLSRVGLDEKGRPVAVGL